MTLITLESHFLYCVQYLQITLSTERDPLSSLNPNNLRGNFSRGRCRKQLQLNQFPGIYHGCDSYASYV